MLLTVLRFNFASPQGDPRTQSRLLSAALDLAQWGESRGITSISVDEHHATGHGWSCNPIMAAAMFLARTSTLIASVDCALGPLWNPVRLAEDIALCGIGNPRGKGRPSGEPVQGQHRFRLAKGTRAAWERVAARCGDSKHGRADGGCDVERGSCAGPASNSSSVSCPDR